MFAGVPKFVVSCGITRIALWNKQIALGCMYKLQNINTNVNVIREFHDVTGDIICPSQVSGISHLRDPRLNKGLAFTFEERQVLGIHGLQPPRFKTQEEQMAICLLSLDRYKINLNKYLYLVELQDRNEKLFFRLLSENVEKLMPIVYTPTVGLACQKFGLIYRRPRGLFITIKDRGNIYEVVKNWPEPDVKCIVVTDGERILGLGDLGACGMGIPVGKLSLYTALAGIKPHQCLPITLDVGTNNQTLLEDPLYIGLRQKRVTGKEYFDFVDEFMEAIVRRYGQNTLIQFEDFGNHNAFALLSQYRERYCTFNDDIQGTASIAVAGVMSSLRVTGKKKISDNTFVFLGAGEAALGIACLTESAMVAEGLTVEEARNKIWMMDIEGLLTSGRPKEKLKGDKVLFAKKTEPMKNLLDVINKVKPSILIGASAAAGAFTPEVLKAMSNYNERPVIFALSNPTSKAECTAQDAYTHTSGRVIFSSGSPFGTVEYNGQTFKPGQGNNAYIFPGIALGVISTGIHHINDEIFLIAAQEVAKMVSDENLKLGSLYPNLSDIRECSLKIAMRLTQYAYDNGMATVYPEPKDKMKYIKDQLYNYFYESALPVTWKWEPTPTDIKVKPIEYAKENIPE